MCPENNSFGYATILKLQELQYPRLYYRQRKGVYIGGYVPKQSPDVAGFTTNGKTRSMILGKLEEVLRNKQLYVPSSRTYEELKTFTWNTGRAQAKRGFHDDLVMSLAIGTWLYDASADYSKSSKNVNEAMLGAMSVKSREYTDNTSAVNVDPFIPFTSNRQNVDKNANKPSFGTNSQKSRIRPDHLWVIK